MIVQPPEQPPSEMKRFQWGTEIDRSLSALTLFPRQIARTPAYFFVSIGYFSCWGIAIGSVVTLFVFGIHSAIQLLLHAFFCVGAILCSQVLTRLEVVVLSSFWKHPDYRVQGNVWTLKGLGALGFGRNTSIETQTINYLNGSGRKTNFEAMHHHQEIQFKIDHDDGHTYESRESARESGKNHYLVPLLRITWPLALVPYLILKLFGLALLCFWVLRKSFQIPIQFEFEKEISLFGLWLFTLFFVYAILVILKALNERIARVAKAAVIESYPGSAASKFEFLKDQGFELVYNPIQKAENP